MPAPFKFRQATKAAALALFVTLLFAASPRAQAPAQREAPSTVSGRVTDGEKGVAGVSVVLMPGDSPVPSRSWARARTDAEGHYQITNVPPGRYQVVVSAPTYVVEGEANFQPGTPLNLSAGEAADNIDFRVVRGGVITGRITDDAGNPVIAEPVSVVPVDNTQGVGRPMSFDPSDNRTDDRGVYRIYGLAPGKYRVSVGTDGGGGAVSFGSRKVYLRTYYPDTTDYKQATQVEVAAGGEADQIDIRLAGPVKTFKASGTFVYSDTGQPAAGIAFGYGALDPTGQRVSNFGGGTQTDARGQFQTGGLTSGRYSVFAYPFGPQNSSEFYSDPVTFEVTGSDVTGLVVKLKRGTTLSGAVVIEGVSDPAAAARLRSQVRVFGYYDVREQTAMPAGYVSPTPVAPDGTFQITGLHPGKVRVMASGENAKGLAVSRIELNGVNVAGEGISVAEGASVSGVRVVMVYGSAVVRGQVNFINGTLPQNARMTASARPVGGIEREVAGRGAQVDARGRFVIEGLAPGEYDVQVQLFAMGGGPNTVTTGGGVGAGQMFMSDKQRVALGEGGETPVTLTLDLSAPVRRGVVVRQ